MAAEQPDRASRARLITHMNADHATDLSLYLRHYLGLSESDAAGAVLLDADLDALTIRSNSGTHAVKYDPPLESWGQRRERLTQMSARARAAVEVSSSSPADGGDRAFVLKQYTPPRGFDIVVFFGVAVYFASAAAVFGGMVEPGMRAWVVLDAVFPGGAGAFRWLVRTIFVPVLALHVVESVWMAWSRMGPLGVPRGNRVWWLWVSSVFFEGVCAYRRLDGLVARLKAEERKGR